MSKNEIDDESRAEINRLMQAIERTRKAIESARKARSVVRNVRDAQRITDYYTTAERDRLTQ
jgi:hypothetical protein